MDISRYIETLESALVGSASTVAPDVRPAVEQVTRAMGPSVRLAFIEMLSDVAAEVTARLDGDVVEVRLRGGSPEIVVDRRGTGVAFQDPPLPARAQAEEDGGTARVSLRLPESLKFQVDEAAAAEGISSNTWLVKAVQRSLGQMQAASPGTSAGRNGRSLTGWVR